jgi:hypothetical protein
LIALYACFGQHRITPKFYFIWVVAVPLVGFSAILCATPALEDEPLWEQIVETLLFVPVLVNVFLGPTIYGFWRHKKSRVIICVLNVLCLFAGGIPGLLLWIWALRGGIDETTVPPPQVTGGTA